MSNDPNYWKSLRELHDKDAVSDAKAHEFMAGVTDDFQISELSAMSRKQFLALLTASAAFAAAGCSNYRDRGEIVPYSKKPSVYFRVEGLHSAIEHLRKTGIFGYILYLYA